MHLISVEITNFMPFGENLRWDIPQPESLMMLVKGEYIGKEKSNGAGKSSLFEAVYWALTGELVRKVKAAQVVRIGTTKCSVTVVFKFKGTRYEVTRTRVHNQPVVVTFLNRDTGEVYPCHIAAEGTQLIMEKLGISPDLLSMVSFFGHGFTTFSRMEPRERAELIAKIAKSDLWEQARVVALARVKSLNIDLSKYSGWEEESLRSIDDTRREIEVAEQELEDKEQQLSIERDQYKIELDQTRKAIKGVTSDRDTAHDTLVLRNVDHNEMQALYDEARQGRAELLGQISGLRSQLKELTKGIKGNTCPTCGQTIKRTGTLKKTIADITSQLEALTLADAELLKDLLVLQQALKEAKGIIADLQKAIQLYDVRIRGYEISSVQVGHSIEALDLDTAKVGLVERLIYLRETQLEKHIASLEEVRVNIDRAKDLLLVNTFWVTGFKVLRLQSLERVVIYLEECINSFAMQLGLAADRVYMDVKAELSGRGFKPEITLGIVRGDNKLTFGQLSTGETRCLDLACFLACGLWLQQVYGLSIDFKVWDEPLEGLDGDSKYKAFQLLKNITDCSQKFVIDHDANFADMFEYTMSVIKGEDDVSGFGDC